MNHFLSSLSFGSNESVGFVGYSFSPTVNGFWSEVPSETVAFNSASLVALIGTSVVAFNGLIG